MWCACTWAHDLFIYILLRYLPQAAIRSDPISNNMPILVKHYYCFIIPTVSDILLGCGGGGHLSRIDLIKFDDLTLKLCRIRDCIGGLNGIPDP